MYSANAREYRPPTFEPFSILRRWPGNENIKSTGFLEKRRDRHVRRDRDMIFDGLVDQRLARPTNAASGRAKGADAVALPQQRNQFVAHHRLQFTRRPGRETTIESPRSKNNPPLCRSGSSGNRHDWHERLLPQVRTQLLLVWLNRRSNSAMAFGSSCNVIP